MVLRCSDVQQMGREPTTETLDGKRPGFAKEAQQRIGEPARLTDGHTPSMPHAEEAGSHPTDPPRSLGRYRVESLLGRGGFGEVWKAYDPLLLREVAIKAPRPDRAPSEDWHRSLLAEARKAAALVHPNIVPVFDVFEEGSTALIVSALVDGPSLSRYSSGRRLPVREIVPLILGVAEALHHAHKQGFVHRDVKPGNILLDASGRAILTDFGLARPEETSAGLTSDGAIIGTPGYMAPEQAAGRADQVGPWTDLYAVGVVLYHMLTGRLPFEGPAVVVLGAVLRDEPPPPRQYRPDLDPALERVVLRAMSKDPRARFAEARDFSAALAGLLTPMTPASSATLVPATPTEASNGPILPRRGGLLRRVRWLAGAALVACGGLSLALMTLSLLTEALGPAFWISLFFALPAILLGPCLWHLAEMSQVPQGLWSAAKSGAAGWVRAAARRGFSLDTPDDLGETALMYAAARGHTEVVKVLLIHGVDTRAASSLGQTAVEIAHARGHGDIVALLQKETRPPRPATATPSTQPSARRWMIGSALFGALLVVGTHWVYDPWPTRISFREMDKLVLSKQVKSIAVRTKTVEGEVKNPSEHPRLTRGRFHADVPDGYSIQSVLADGDPRLRVGQIAAGKFSRIPPDWSIVLVLGIPMFLAALVSWPLGSAYWFPILRPWRR